MNNQPEIESGIRERLNEIKGVPPRNPQAAARGRARFLAQAASAREAQRSTGWRSIFRVQQFAMNMAVTLIVIIGLLAGAGTTVKAAQSELPGEPLYVVKTFSEDVSLQLQSSPQAKVDRLMQLAQTRVEEMTRLIEAGQTPPEQVRLRLEQHLQQALQLCSNMDDAELNQMLPQVRDQLQQQEQALQSLQVDATQNTQPILERTSTMLQTQLHMVNDGLGNHELFRNAVHNGFHYGQTQTPPAAMPLLPSTPYQVQGGPVTTPPGNQGNGNSVGPNPNPGEPRPHVTPTPRNPATDPGNNAGGNNKDKGKDPKTKDPKDNKPSTKTPK